jgi:hypothetical protein
MTDLTHSIRKCAPITRITQVLAAIYTQVATETLRRVLSPLEPTRPA